MYHPSLSRLRWLGLACAAAVVACGSLAGSATGQVQAKKANKTITITIWVEQQAPGWLAALKADAKAFDKTHPGVKVVPVGKATNVLADQEPLALRTSTGPDIAEAWQLGYGTLGRMVKDHSLLPLDKYVKQYGWDKREGSSLLDSARFTSDGSTWGTGPVYALPWAGGALGVFYNKQKLAALGVGVPTTFEQFLSDLALAKKAGEVPLELGDAQGFPLLHDFQVFTDAYGGATTWSSFVFGKGHGTATFSSPSVLAGSGVVAKLGADGDFNSDHAGTQLVDMVNRFTKGEGVFMITGTWFAAQIQQGLGSNAGFFAMPGSNGRAPLTNGSANPFAISAKSKNPDVAAQFLNYMISPAGVTLLLKAGGFAALPVTTSQMKSVGVSPTSALGEGYTMFAKLLKAGSLLPFLDWSTPSMLQTADSNLELLVAGKMSASDFVSAVQKDYNTYWKK